MKCLEPEPARRYPTSKALADDIDRYLKGQRITARPASLARRLRRRLAKRKGVVAAAAGGLVAVVVLAAVLVPALRRTRAQLSERETQLSEEARRAESAQEALAKSLLVSKVLARWSRLQPALRRLQAAAADARLSVPERGERLAAVMPEIEAFARETPPDPTSQSAMMAFRGWARLLAGQEGLADMDEAARLDPDLPYGHLLQALTAFSQYLEMQELPQVIASGAGLDFGPALSETSGMAELSRRVDERLAKARAARVWGRESAEDFGAAMDGMRAMQTGDFAAAETALSRALAAPDLRVFETHLLYARARVRYLRKDFEPAWRDLSEAVQAQPGNPLLLQHVGTFHAARALQKDLAGEDPRPLFREALAAFEEAARLNPTNAYIHNHRGTTLVQTGEADERRGRDALRAYSEAVDAFREAMRLNDREPIFHADCARARHASGRIQLETWPTATARCGSTRRTSRRTAAGGASGARWPTWSWSSAATRAGCTI